MPLKYATQIAALAPALSRQYKKVLLYKCPPYPLHPGGNVVLGYHRTEKCSERLSPIVTRALCVWLAIEYAVAASIVPGLSLFGFACTNKFRSFPTCK